MAQMEHIDTDAMLKAARAAASETTDEEREKIRQTMHEFKHGTLHSYRAGLPKRKMPKVKDRSQAIAIALSQARRLSKRDASDVVDRNTDDDTDQAPGGAGSENPHGTGSIEEIKSRWIQEGHHDIDDALMPAMHHASHAILGRKEKMQAVSDQRDNAWRAIGEAQDTYDRVREHMHDHHHLMVEVPHMKGLLYNPEHVGEDHFHPNGKPKHRITLLHPTEANDWIERHGKDAKKADEGAPIGLITDIRQLTQRVA